MIPFYQISRVSRAPNRPIFDVFMFLFLICLRAPLRGLAAWWFKLRFWLTTSVVCSWCGRVKHSAPLVPWTLSVSHGICRDCLTQMQASVNHDVFNSVGSAPASGAPARALAHRPASPAVKRSIETKLRNRLNHP